MTIANDIKRNLAILEDTLVQCSNETQTNYDGNTSELKIELEKMMVTTLKKIFFQYFMSLLNLISLSLLGRVKTSRKSSRYLCKYNDFN